MNPVWLRIGAGGAATVAVHAQPGARRTEVVGLHGESLKIRLAAPPVDGKANAALRAFVAERLGVPAMRVELVAGASSREKRLRVSGVDAATLLERLTPV
jgi:hypothetical protein